MTLGEVLEAVEVVNGIALRLCALPMCLISCMQGSKEAHTHTKKSEAFDMHVVRSSRTCLGTCRNNHTIGLLNVILEKKQAEESIYGEKVHSMLTQVRMNISGTLSRNIFALWSAITMAHMHLQKSSAIQWFIFTGLLALSLAHLVQDSDDCITLWLSRS